MKKSLGVIFIISIILSSCIFGKLSKKVMSFRYNNVYLSGSSRDYYKVGDLSESWKKISVPVYAIAFYNDKWGATIATDAFCGPSFEDLSLEMLTSHFISGVQKTEIIESYDFMLDQRGARRTVVKGEVDGVAMTFDVVVLKKDKCNFDFMLIVPEGLHPKVAADFKSFYTGFKYSGEKSILK